jgi:putative FmdB family regulatory protein
LPTYDYRCDQCGKMQFTQKITEPALENCPNCHGPIKRIISRNVGILFKGSGFYCKDHAEYTGKPLPGREATPDFSDAYEKVEEKPVESPAASSENQNASGPRESIKVNSESKTEKASA